MPSNQTDARTKSAVALAAIATITLLAGCAAAGTAGSSSAGSAGSSASAPVKVGLVYSRSGLLAAYGAQYEQGFKAGLDYATHGTGKAGGHTIELTEQDDAGDPAKAVADAKGLIGKGYKILAGTTDSGVALQMAPLAAQNQVLYIDGAAASDGITGINKYTFRSGRQSYQDILTAAAMLGDAKGKKVTVVAQDTAFGQANVAAVKAVLGAKGASVGSVLAPPSATDLTPFAQQVKSAKPSLVFVAWAGATAPALWTAMNQQGVLDSTKVVTGMAGTASYPVFGAGGSKLSFLAHYFPGAGGGNPVETAMIKGITKAGGTPDLFSPDGFTAAQMIVHAIESGSATDTSAMVKSLEGWSFNGVKGAEQVRAQDHALLQPMFEAQLTGSGATARPKLLKSLPMSAVAPPLKKMAG
ncbi:substrate-binding domain-containing protein [Actinacidiphila oryziradicis]|uniref:Amino acid ABC transporter substrate-binding protein n=1 Tax=Actinacidiphila oryziradicis TaxID=2571141 RepID=A0A4U0SK17_9ACTN|nr:substrate-binding domain-containing protein [Actinacidiphila oryziradicis]TKA09318.1 amino acid ABC transporter substrate-binding protein [Actinacidiphila oryziradicis]